MGPERCFLVGAPVPPEGAELRCGQGAGEAPERGRKT
jgi:hypothetical protein